MTTPAASPRVPLTPQPLDALRARYHLAVSHVCDQVQIARGQAPAPSGDAVHVFDTTDGLRLIVSLDRLPDGRVGTHLSASVHDWPVVLDRCSTVTELLRCFAQTWQAISGSAYMPELLGISDGGVPHFFLERGH